MALFRCSTSSGGGSGIDVNTLATALESGGTSSQSSSSGVVSGFTVGKTYLVCYSRGSSNPHGVSSGGTELGSYNYFREVGSTNVIFYVGIITATSTSITFLGNNNLTYYTELD